MTGVTAAGPDTAAIRARTDGASKTSRTDTSTPRTAPARAASRIADSELPPRSKNDAATETCGRPSRSANTPATAVSVPVSRCHVLPRAPKLGRAGLSVDLARGVQRQLVENNPHRRHHERRKRLRDMLCTSSRASDAGET